MSDSVKTSQDSVELTLLWHLEIYYTSYSFMSKEELIDFLFTITKDKIDHNLQKYQATADKPSDNPSNDFFLTYFRGVSYSRHRLECNKRGEHTLAALTAFVDSLVQGLTWFGFSWSSYKEAFGIIKEHHRLSENLAYDHQFIIKLSALCPKRNMFPYHLSK